MIYPRCSPRSQVTGGSCVVVRGSQSRETRTSLYLPTLTLPPMLGYERDHTVILRSTVSYSPCPRVTRILPSTCMASFLPIIKDLIPIVMPSSVHVTKSTALDEGTGQTEGMIRQGAIIDKSVKICASGELACRLICILFLYKLCNFPKQAATLLFRIRQQTLPTSPHLP